MYEGSAAYYDDIYVARDSRAVASAIAMSVSRERFEAASVLDVACGTGRHLEAWRDDFHVEGLDLNRELLTIAAHGASACRSMRPP